MKQSLVRFEFTTWHSGIFIKFHVTSIWFVGLKSILAMKRKLSYPAVGHHLPTWLTCASQLEVELRSEYPFKILPFSNRIGSNHMKCPYLQKSGAALILFAQDKTRFLQVFSNCVMLHTVAVKNGQERVKNCQNGQKRFYLCYGNFQVWLFFMIWFFIAV